MCRPGVPAGRGRQRAACAGAAGGAADPARHRFGSGLARIRAGLSRGNRVGPGQERLRRAPGDRRNAADDRARAAARRSARLRHGPLARRRAGRNRRGAEPGARSARRDPERDLRHVGAFHPRAGHAGLCPAVSVRHAPSRQAPVFRRVRQRLRGPDRRFDPRAHDSALYGRRSCGMSF